MGVTCICIRLRLRVGILQSQWSLGRSVVVEHGSTKKHIDFPPPVGSDTKVSFPAVMLCTASRCYFLNVTLNDLAYCLSGLKHNQTIAMIETPTIQ